MTDIVERLHRSPYERELKDKAADEIERLREALDKALKQSEIGAWTATRETIRAALQKDEGRWPDEQPGGPPAGPPLQKDEGK